MTAYRNLTVNLTKPTTKLDRCAVAIMSVLNANSGQRVYVWDIDKAILNAKADLRLKPMALKALRNMGYAITAAKARHNSWYKLAGTSIEYEDHRQRLVKEMYSCMLTHCRELHGAVSAQPTDLSLNASLSHAQILAISLGTDTAIGKTIPEVMADLAPLP